MTSRQLIKSVVRNVRILQPKNLPPVVVVSPGGVATTSLLTHLRKFIHCNDPDDLDDLKHLPFPISYRNARRQTKFIFITGNTEQIVASLKRRGWIANQGAKLGSPAAVVFKGRRAERALKNAIDKQKHRWTLASLSPSSPDILVIEFEDLWMRISELQNFVNIESDEFAQTFPARKARATELKT